MRSLTEIAVRKCLLKVVTLLWPASAECFRFLFVLCRKRTFSANFCAPELEGQRYPGFTTKMLQVTLPGQLYRHKTQFPLNFSSNVPPSISSAFSPVHNHFVFFSFLFYSQSHLNMFFFSTNHKVYLMRLFSF